MAIDFTVEEKVTSLLSSNEIIKPKDCNFYILNPMLDTLGDFLDDIDEEYQLPVFEEKLSKYVFIKN